MRVAFLGTRGEIALRSRHHRRHTSTAILAHRRCILTDFGQDWLGVAGRVAADAIVLTHAHSDHAGGLRRGSACPVYATPDTWHIIGRWPIRERRTIEPWTPSDLGGIVFEAVPLAHSVRAPAVGYRITAGDVTIFYAPDVAAISNPDRALAGVCLYIGDGATIARPLLRTRDDTFIGHASIATQLDWCRARHVSRAIFTHCGSAIVRAGDAAAGAKVAALGRAHGLIAAIARDGLTIQVRRGSRPPS